MRKGNLSSQADLLLAEAGFNRRPDFLLFSSCVAIEIEGSSGNGDMHRDCRMLFAMYCDRESEESEIMDTLNTNLRLDLVKSVDV